MIKLEFPKANLNAYESAEDKVKALKGQVDTLSTNLQIILDSIDESIGEDAIRELVSPDIDSIAGSVDELSERTDELESHDFIAEQGTSGIWKYRKWNSGKSECWGQAESNNITNVSVNGWYGGAFTPPDFPSGLFVTTPHCWANLTYWGNGYHFGCAYSVSTTRCSVLGIRNDNVSSKMYADIYAMGRWK